MSMWVVKWMKLSRQFQASFFYEKILSMQKASKHKITNFPSLRRFATAVYPYQPAYKEFICTHLFLFVIICENPFLLWESFGISIICVNLCLYENKQAYECHHLKQIFYHQN